MKKLVHLFLAIAMLCVFGASDAGWRFVAQPEPAPVTANASSVAKSCNARTSPSSAGDDAMVRENYPKAIEAFTAEMAADGTEGERAHNGLIRALLAANEVDEAESAAKAWVAASPGDAWGKTSLGEVELRKGDIPAAFTTLQSAQSADQCIAQMQADLARVYALTGMFATAKRLLDSAHQLDPVDSAIELQWIESEPQQAQVEEWGNYIERNASLLSDRRKASLLQRIKRLKLPQSDNCLLSKPATSAKLPYYMIQNGTNAYVFWGLQVVIDGKKLNLAEDSTISGILLTKSAAEKAHLQPIDGVEVEGIGSASAYTANAARADTVRIGPLEFEHCDVIVAKDDMRYYGETPYEKSHNMFLERGSDGLIGPDAFRDFIVTLDKPDREFRLDPLPGPLQSDALRLVTGVAPEPEPLHDRFVDSAMTDWMRGYRSEQFMLFPVRLNQSLVGMYSIASNSRQNTISLELAKQMKIAGSFAHELPSMTGHAGEYFLTSAVKLEFLGMKWQLDSMSAVNMTPWSESHGVQLTGMLGAPMMDHFTVHLDYRDNLIKVEYDPKKVRNCPANIHLPGCY